MRTEDRTDSRIDARSSQVVARLAAVGSAVPAALLVWAAFELIGGVDLRAPAPGGAGETHDVGALTVVLPSLLASLAGWALLAVLEGRIRRARATWTIVALAVLLLSLAGPVTATGITTANQLALASMHLAVAAVLIPLLARTSEPAARRAVTD